MGDYDKVIKENITAILLTLSEKLLGFTFTNPIDLPEKVQATMERDPDFLKKVTLEDGSEVILHLEFQTADDPKMVYRMAEYKAMLQRKFGLPVRQLVIYLGTGKSKMVTELKPQEQITGFELRNIQDLPVEQALESDIPEEIVLAVLSDYPKADSAKIIGRILHKLREVAPNKAELKKFLQQLMILNRMRNLGLETQKQVEDMPITYNIEADHLYKEGVAKGIERGIAKGIERGREEGIAKGIERGITQERESSNRRIMQEKEKIVRNMLAAGLSMEQIVDMADTTLEFVRRVKEGR